MSVSRLLLQSLLRDSVQVHFKLELHLLGIFELNFSFAINFANILFYLVINRLSFRRMIITYILSSTERFAHDILKTF